MRLSPVAVLVIESHPLMRAALCAAIASEPGLEVAGQAANLEEALGMIPTLRPNLILLAVGDHGLDDSRAIPALRERLPGTPILALISDETPWQEQAALSAGAQAALPKTAARRELIGRLHELCRNS